MIATIPLATGNKLNCFISARGMLAIVWHCVLLFCCFFLCVFFVDFLHVNKSSSQKKKCATTKNNYLCSTFVHETIMHVLCFLYIILVIINIIYLI